MPLRYPDTAGPRFLLKGFALHPLLTGGTGQLPDKPKFEDRLNRYAAICILTERVRPYLSDIRMVIRFVSPPQKQRRRLPVAVFTFCISQKRAASARRQIRRVLSILFIPNRIRRTRVEGTASAAIMDRGVLCSLYENRIWLCGQQHPYL